MNPRDELREIIDEYLGMDVANLFDQVIEEIEYDLTPDEIGDDYEAISDGYRNMLVDTMNELQEIVYAKRIDRKRLERLWQNLNKNL
ncbi:MAG: hypothetical protein IJV15_07965 [Lachnospiraceae bacterium]|nr:hypothetical protein [Lachnospiraceae bacterium]